MGNFDKLQLVSHLEHLQRSSRLTVSTVSSQPSCIRTSSTSSIRIMSRTSYRVTQVIEGSLRKLTGSRSNTVFILYLNKETWLGELGLALAQEVRAACAA